LAPDRLARRWGELGSSVAKMCSGDYAIPPIRNIRRCPSTATKRQPKPSKGPTGAFVFKTLNTTGAGNMAEAADYPVKPVMLVAGDDAGRKRTVMELVGKLGFESVDAGPLKNARLLEPFAMVWIDQAMKRGRGRDFAFALVNMR